MLPEIWLPMEDLLCDGIEPNALIELTLEDGATIIGIVMDYPSIRIGGDSSVPLLLGERVVHLEHCDWYHPLTDEHSPLWTVWSRESSDVHHREHVPTLCKLRVAP